MIIAVPSYNRVQIFKTKTFKVLTENGVSVDDIYLFVANQEQYDAYRSELPEELKIIIGEKGICNIRNFMANYFNEGDIIVYMDDDIEKVKMKNNKTFFEALTEACEYLKTSEYNLIGLPPTYNEFFNKDDGFKTGLLVVIGCFFIMRNDKSITVDNPTVEDLQRTVKCFLKYGGTIRYCDIMVKTKPFAAGGINEADGRDYDRYYKAVVKLYFEYSPLITMYSKKIKYISNEPVPHIRFKALKSPPTIALPPILQLPSVNPEIFKQLLEILGNTLLTLKPSWDKMKARKEAGLVMGSYRKNFPEHRTDVFGYVKQRPLYGGGTVISRASERKAKLYEELKRIGDIICPFPYTSILINRNTVCGKHHDSNNVGRSLLISIGDYEGCNIMIEGKKYDAKYTPTIFNGSELEHWNSDDLVGNKYSIVYYCIPLS
jgi:hypothetical protein